MGAEEDLERCWEAGDADGARRALDELARLHSDAPGWTFRRGVLEEQTGHLDEATAWYRRTIERDAGWSDAWVNLGRILDDRRAWDEALACYERAVALPDGARDPVAWSNRGNTLMSLERFDDALASFDRALGLAPGDGASRLGRRVTLGWLGRLAESNALVDREDPLDRGEIRERRHPAGDRHVVARYFVGRHSHPEWLDEQAEAVVAGVARLVDRPPGLGDGIRIQWGWSNLMVRERGSDWILCEPDFAEDPLGARVWDVSFTLQTVLMHQMTCHLAKVQPVDCRMQDAIGLLPGTLEGPSVVLLAAVRPSGRRVVGLIAGPADLVIDPHDPGIERRTTELARLRTALVKVLVLPPGWSARFEGHAVVSILDPSGQERWG